ncbi:MAG TPA: NAD(P)-dependent oxidoreductase [Acidimicrobiia bacterium]|nr:NAD(P)-dependent oxidoreductase [Acidimicrobiia bacterium]
MSRDRDVATSRPDRHGCVSGRRDGGTPADVVHASEITILCVPRSADVIDVLDSASPAFGDGKIIVDTSTIDPDVEHGQHERVNAGGARCLEAPLSGGTVGAEQGSLTLMVGGDAGVLEAARPALDPFAGRILNVGGPGSGQIVKLCNNLIYAVQTLATAEAATMAAKSGVDLRKLHDVITHSTGDCNAVRTRIPFEGVLPDGPASNDWKPGFMTDLMAKDLDIVIGFAARSNTPLFTSGIVRQLLGAASAAGYGREDFSSMGKIVRALAGV